MRVETVAMMAEAPRARSRARKEPRGRTKETKVATARWKTRQQGGRGQA